MMDLKALLATAAAVSLPSYLLYTLLIHPFLISPLRRLPGPTSNPFTFMGFLTTIIKEEAAAPHLRWAKQYGGIVMYRLLFNRGRVLVTSPTGLKRVLGTHTHLYPKIPMAIKTLRFLLGNGLLAVEGDIHKRQRAMINPVFRVKNIASMVPVFSKYSAEFRDSWIETIESQTTENAQDRKVYQFDIYEELSKVTLDIIGKAGFNYTFGAIKDNKSPLFDAFQSLLSSVTFVDGLLESLFPGFRNLPIARNKKNSDAENALTDEEVASQVLTFLAAGHETTSVALSWTLHLLSLNPDIQAKLRAEVSSVLEDASDLPTWENFSTMPYLEAVAKESMRLIPPVPITTRIAAVDDVIDGHFIPKGTSIIICPAVNHRLEEFWGSDADDFKPERWLTQDEGLRPFGAFMPFLLGPRNCIGSKFAMTELKTILATIIRNFAFEPVPGLQVKKKLEITWKPHPSLKLNVSRVN
ncbi:cytochrome P450 [Chytridium lagenaria]|nr:cytochrome P450 [Chytridium lagenaria]